MVSRERPTGSWPVPPRRTACPGRSRTAGWCAAAAPPPRYRPGPRGQPGALRARYFHARRKRGPGRRAEYQLADRPAARPGQVQQRRRIRGAGDPGRAAAAEQVVGAVLSSESQVELADTWKVDPPRQAADETVERRAGHGHRGGGNAEQLGGRQLESPGEQLACLRTGCGRGRGGLLAEGVDRRRRLGTRGIFGRLQVAGHLHARYQHVGEAGAGAPATTLLAAEMVTRSQFVAPGRTGSACTAPVSARSVLTLPAAVLTRTRVATERSGSSTSSWMPIVDGRSSVRSKLIWIHWPTGV